MITLAEVIEQCAKECEEIDANPHVALHHAVVCAAAIRALAAKYEGCIVAEGERVMVMVGLREDLPLYRAKEPTK